MGHSHFKLFVNNKSSSKKCLQCFCQSYTWNINILWLTNKVLKLHRLSLINFNHWSLFLFFNISFSLWFTQWKKTSDKFPECFAQSEAFRRDCMRQKHLENERKSSVLHQMDRNATFCRTSRCGLMCQHCVGVVSGSTKLMLVHVQHTFITWKHGHTTRQTVTLTMNTS